MVCIISVTICTNIDAMLVLNVTLVVIFLTLMIPNKVSKVLVLNPNTGLITMGEGETLLDRLVTMRKMVKTTKLTMRKMVKTTTLMLMMTLMLRERADSHYLTVEARDERGRGNRNTVELVIRSSSYCQIKKSKIFPGKGSCFSI